MMAPVKSFHANTANTAQLKGLTGAKLALSSVLIVGPLFACGGGGGGGSSLEAELPSDVSLSLTNVSESSFNPTGEIVRFAISGGTLVQDMNSLTVLHNESLVPPTGLSLTAGELVLLDGLTEGLNNIEVFAQDPKGRILNKQVALWAGSHPLVAFVVDRFGIPSAGASVEAFLGEDPRVRVRETTDATGIALLHDLPDRTIVLSYHTALHNNEFGTLAVNGADGDAFLGASWIGQPSSVDNNDFAQGVLGWELGIAPVDIVVHEEGDDSFERTDDFDLRLSTLGEGPQSVKRTFSVEPGTKSVVVRYRFITSEFPAGYFGTKYNDYYSVTIRSLLSEGRISDGNGMNGLGRGAFSAEGATMWKEATLPVNRDGDTVQVDISVANVSDGKYDSQLIVDLVKEAPLVFADLEILNTDGSPQRLLSAAPHAYFGGNTRIHGKMSIEGSAQDALQFITLEVLQGGTVVARGSLAPEASAILLRPFGSDGKVAISNSQTLFYLPSAELSRINTSANGAVSLRVRARSVAGFEVMRDAQSLGVLDLYRPLNRYGSRDLGLGGDDWLLPSVLSHVELATSVTFNDMSKMNGGRFSPHASHDRGVDVDGTFVGYSARGRDSALIMLGHLNSTYGRRINKVFVTYSDSPPDEFFQTIRGVFLVDGRLATDVIRKAPQHETHFHWRFFSD